MEYRHIMWYIWGSLVAQLVKNPPAIQETLFNSWVGKIRSRRDMPPTLLSLGFPGGSSGKESACNAGDLGLIPELGRSPGEGKGYPLQYSGLENSMNCIVRGVAKSQAWLNVIYLGKISFHSVLTQFWTSLGHWWLMLIMLFTEPPQEPGLPSKNLCWPRNKNNCFF